MDRLTARGPGLGLGLGVGVGLGFCITVFAMDEAFESRSKEMLTKAFALYPDRQYALLTLPHTTPEFPLLNAFTQVRGRGRRRRRGRGRGRANPNPHLDGGGECDAVYA